MLLRIRIILNLVKRNKQKLFWPKIVSSNVSFGRIHITIDQGKYLDRQVQNRSVLLDIQAAISTRCPRNKHTVIIQNLYIKLYSLKYYLRTKSIRTCLKSKYPSL